jgi:outer membrane protein OmpA-like peptidoglycan-associated protein
MRRHLLTRIFDGPAIPLAVCIVLSACATPDASVGREAKGPLGGPVSPKPPESVAPPGPADESGGRREAGPPRSLDRRDNVYFAQGSAAIDEAGRETIRQHAERLKNNRQLIVMLVGHSTDRGSTEYKVALGQKRVDAVADELRSAGAASGQIRKRSYPSEKSVVDRCATESCDEADRRVELRYIDLKTPPTRRVP